jgi:hypothetical protein
VTRAGRPPYEVRKRWSNHTGNQWVEPLRVYDARSLEDLVAIVREAAECGATVRAVGSGHSWSDVALTTGFLVQTHRMGAVLPLEDARPGLDTSKLIRSEAGIRLRALNRELDRRKLALSNMGGYDAQTLAGVMSTSTHGSGIELGPIADAVRSIDLVASGGRVIRVEPSNGITDRAAFEARHPDRRLEQDDDWFDAARVGMGCMGLVHSAVVEVRDRYWLKEVRRGARWSELREPLRDRDVLRSARHYEVYFNPYRGRDGDNRCLVTTRDPVPRPRSWLGDPSRRRNSIPEFTALLPVTPHVLNLITDVLPRTTPKLLDRALDALADDEYTSISYKVLNIGTANLLPAYSAEIGVPVDERGSHVEAVDRIIEVAERRRRAGDVFETSPISLRFVKGSSAYMSMMHERTTMMIELIQMTRTDGGYELLAEYEEALYDLGGRPHWGQVNTLTGSHDLVRSMYPRYDDWLRIHAEIDEDGTFDSPFSKRVGISESRFDPRVAGP